MENRNPLGKGLAALLGENFVNDDLNKGVGKRDFIPVSFIIPNIKQPRKIFDDEKIKELALSIQQKGVLQPLVVRKKDEFYEIIAGERRWRASKQAGLSNVPVVILECDDEEALEIGLIENLQRQDLNPIEEAESLKVLQDKYGKSQEEISVIVSKSRSHVANILRLNSLPEFIKNKIKDGEISAGHARALINTSNPNELVEKIINEKLNVRDTEQIGKNLKTNKSKVLDKGNNPTDDDINIVEKKLMDLIGLPVNIKCKKNSGTLTIDFNSFDDLDYIIYIIEN